MGREPVTGQRWELPRGGWRGAHGVPQIYEGVSSLLDKLGVWHHLADGTSDLKEMAQTGLRVLLGYILLQDPQVGHPSPGAAVPSRWPRLTSPVPCSCTRWPT